MRKIPEILTCRLTHGFSLEKTALAVRKSKGCVYRLCSQFAAPGLPWPLPGDMTDEQLEQAVYHERATSGDTNAPKPDIAALRGCEIDQPRNLAKSVTVE